MNLIPKGLPTVLLNRALACIAVVSLAPLALTAQAKPDAVRTELVSSLNRIHLYDQGASWHVSIKAQMVDQGTPTNAGTVDIYRKADGTLRTVFAFPSFHQTRYISKETLVEGDAGDPPAGLQNFIHYFDTAKQLDQLQHDKLRPFSIKFRTVNFDCTRASDPTTGNGPTYCDIPPGHALRYNTIGGSYVTLFEQMTTFENGDAPTRATVFFQYQPIARLSITYAPLSQADRSVRPPASAVILSNTTENINSVLNSKLIDPFVHPGPTQIAPPDNGAALFRFEIQNHRIQHIEVLASSDKGTLKDVEARIHRTLNPANLPAEHVFVNYPYVLYVVGKNADLNETMPDMIPLDE